MRLRLLAALAAAPLLAGCTLTLDPNSVERPTTTGGSCTPVGCTGKACGYDDCGHVCTAGVDPCSTTHTIRGGLVAGGGRIAATATAHGIQGELVPSASSPAASGGHSVSQGTVSR